MEEEILTQDEDDIEAEMRNIEKEEEVETKGKKQTAQKAIEKSVTEETTETYEGFTQPARMGIVNTVTGEVIDGFKPGEDEGMVQAMKVILNKLDKIAIVSGV